MTKRTRRAVGAFAAAAAALAGLVVAGAPANATHVQCGAVITQSVTLDSNVGPCPGNGIVVRGNNITVNLNGFRVFAANGPEETAGIRLGMVSGVTVMNGTVEGFDAGIAIFGGSGNRIRGVTVQNNINDLQEPFAWTPGTPMPAEQQPLMLCDLGDGITTFNSDNNVIEGNRVVNNGPFSGIALVDESDNNVVRGNQVLDNNAVNISNRANGTTGPGLCGATAPGTPGMQRGREVQAIGIRVEGPGGNNNQIQGNQVVNSALVGISLHSHVCNAEQGDPRGNQQPNTGNFIVGNDVRRTGAETSTIDPFADGIASLAQGPIGRVTCAPFGNTIAGNRSSENMRHGISLNTLTTQTVVDRNVVLNNAATGVAVDERATDNTLTGNRGQGNARFDGADRNPNCDNNDWRANAFVRVNQPCVAGGGGTGTVVPAP